MKFQSFAFCGGAYGDEGKGRIVDEFVNLYASKSNVIVYRDNGGANAGHTIEFPSGKRIAFHQLPSGVFNKKATIILGKGMVIHPADLVSELAEVKQVKEVTGTAQILIDEMATLSLDTHRAFEAALKSWTDGSKAATGRGISPAYSDILLRHPLRLRDVVEKKTDLIIKHYRMYKALIKGLGTDLATYVVPALGVVNGNVVGDESEFIDQLVKSVRKLKPYIANIHDVLKKTWQKPGVTYIFEKAQAIGLDSRWGVYPDITASDTTLDGIYSASEGIINPGDIAIRAGVIKATYMSSVGTRILPTVMDETLASRIREDAHEYGATTRRPRGIAHLDIPALSYFAKVGKFNRLVLTHMDVVYEDASIKVCTEYKVNGKTVGYRPDQQYLLTVKPVYREFEPWDKNDIQKARKQKDIPKSALKFIKFLEKAIGVKIMILTTGPQRDQSIIL